MNPPRLRAVVRTVVTLSTDGGSSWTQISATDRGVVLESKDPDEGLAPRGRKSAALIPSVREEK